MPDIPKRILLGLLLFLFLVRLSPFQYRQNFQSLVKSQEPVEDDIDFLVIVLLRLFKTQF